MAQVSQRLARLLSNIFDIILNIFMIVSSSSSPVALRTSLRLLVATSHYVPDKKYADGVSPVRVLDPIMVLFNPFYWTGGATCTSTRQVRHIRRRLYERTLVQAMNFKM